LENQDAPRSQRRGDGLERRGVVGDLDERFKHDGGIEKIPTQSTGQVGLDERDLLPPRSAGGGRPTARKRGV